MYCKWEHCSKRIQLGTGLSVNPVNNYRDMSSCYAAFSLKSDIVRANNINFTNNNLTRSLKYFIIFNLNYCFF